LNLLFICAFLKTIHLVTQLAIALLFNIKLIQIVCFRIGLVEKQIEDWKFEENNLEEQKERLAERVSHSPS